MPSPQTHLLPKRLVTSSRLMVVLDLDNTLVYANTSPVAKNYNFKFSLVCFEGKQWVEGLVEAVGENLDVVLLPFLLCGVVCDRWRSVGGGWPFSELWGS